MSKSKKKLKKVEQYVNCLIKELNGTGAVLPKEVVDINNNSFYDGILLVAETIKHILEEE